MIFSLSLLLQSGLIFCDVGWHYAFSLVSQAHRAFMLMKLFVLLLPCHMTVMPARDWYKPEVSKSRCRMGVCPPNAPPSPLGAHPGHPSSAVPCVLRPNKAFFFHSGSDLQLCSCLADSILNLQWLKYSEEKRHTHTHTQS